MTNTTKNDRGYLLRNLSVLQRTIVNQISTDSKTTVKDIASRLDNSSSHMQRIVDSLLDYQIIQSNLSESEGRGRTPRTYSLNPEFGHFIGFNVRSHHGVEWATLDFSGDVIETGYQEVHGREPTAFVEEMQRKINTAIGATTNNGYGPLLGTGVGAPGLIDIAGGRIGYLPNLPDWDGYPIADHILQDSGAPCSVDNTVRCMALAEYRQGIGKDGMDFLYVYIGDGIGAALIDNGRLYKGRNGGAIELGHVQVSENGPQCNCGNTGCLEVYASQPHILKTTMQMMSESVHSSMQTSVTSKNLITLDHIREAASSGDKLANSIIHSVGMRIGVGLSTLANLFDPMRIVITGEVVTAFFPYFQDTIKTMIKVHALNGISMNLDILQGTVHNNPGAIGAAYLTFERLVSANNTGYSKS